MGRQIMRFLNALIKNSKDREKEREREKGTWEILCMNGNNFKKLRRMDTHNSFESYTWVYFEIIFKHKYSICCYVMLG